MLLAHLLAITQITPAYVLVILAPFVLLFGLIRLFTWRKRTLDTRAWLDDSIDPESKAQRWHEDADAVMEFVFIVALTGVMVGLAVLLWPTPYSISRMPKNTVIVVNHRLGPFFIGEGKQEVEAVVGTGQLVRARKEDVNGNGSETDLYPVAALRVVYLTHQGKAGVFVVETTSPRYRTKTGIGVGSTAEQVKKLGAHCNTRTECEIQDTDAGIATFFVLDSRGRRVIRVGVGGQFN